MQKSLLKLIKRYRGALILEDIISHKTRKFLIHFCGSFAGFLLIGAVFSSKEFATKLRGGFLGFFLLFLFFVVLEAYFYSSYKARRIKKDMLSFEAARMIFYAQDDDLTVGFLYCDTGDEVLKRLGFTEEEIGKILRERPAISFSGELLDLSSGATLHDLMHLIFEKDLFLQHVLCEKNISFEDFFHTVKWVLEKEEREIFDERWWSEEKLQRIPALGKNWSHREIINLQKYSTDLTESGLSHFASYEAIHDSNVSKIESALRKEKSSNVILVTEEETLSMDLIFMLARRIRENRSLGHLSHSRVFLLNTDFLLKGAYNKLSFEKEVLSILSEAVQARNIILVFPFWTEFEKKVREIGSDLTSLTQSFLESPAHLVFLESKKDFDVRSSKNQTLLSHAETIIIEESDNHYLEGFLEREIEEVEMLTNVIFTYKGIKEVINILRKYGKNSDIEKEAKKLIVDSVQITKTNKRKFVLPEDVLAVLEKKSDIS